MFKWEDHSSLFTTNKTKKNIQIITKTSKQLHAYYYQCKTYIQTITIYK